MGNKVKFIQMLEDPVFTNLQKIGKRRGVNIQELLRAVVIPDWLQKERRRRLQKLRK